MSVAKPSRLPVLTRLFTKWKTVMWKETIANVLGKQYRRKVMMMMDRIVPLKKRTALNPIATAAARTWHTALWAGNLNQMEFACVYTAN